MSVGIKLYVIIGAFPNFMASSRVMAFRAGKPQFMIIEYSLHSTVDMISIIIFELKEYMLDCNLFSRLLCKR